MSTIVEAGVPYTETGQPVFAVSQIKESPIFQVVNLVRMKMYYNNTETEEEEYEKYLKAALIKADILSRRISETHITVDAKTLKDELQFWKTRNFIWPSILPNFKGGVILAWKVGDENIRFERLGNDQYSIFIFSSKLATSPKSKVSRDRKKILQHDLPKIYASMVNNAKSRRSLNKEILWQSVSFPLPGISEAR